MTDNQTNEIDRIWDFLPDQETKTGFAYFLQYYLSQSPPRSTIGAYRLYIAGRDNLPIDDPKVVSRRKLPSHWKRYAYGLDMQQTKIKGAKTWQERGRAYDLYLQRKLHERVEAKKIESTFRALEDIDGMLDKWRKMYEVARLLDKTQVRETTRTETTPDGKQELVRVLQETYKVNVGEIRSLIGAYNQLRELERRELGLPQRINQNQLADNEGGEFKALGKGMTDVLSDALQEIQAYKRNKRGDDDNGA